VKTWKRNLNVREIYFLAINEQVTNKYGECENVINTWIHKTEWPKTHREKRALKIGIIKGRKEEFKSGKV